MAQEGHPDFRRRDRLAGRHDLGRPQVPGARSIPGGYVQPPTDAPTVALKDLNDKDVTVGPVQGAGGAGKNFWATWCGTLQGGNPLDD